MMDTGAPPAERGAGSMASTPLAAAAKSLGEAVGAAMGTAAAEIERAIANAEEETARRFLDEIARYTVTAGIDRTLGEHFARFVQRGGHRS